MTTFSYKNERKHIRRAVRLGCQVVREADFRLVGETALDVCPDGLLVATHRTDLEVGQGLIVSFKATSLGLWFDTEAEIVRVLRGYRTTDNGRAVGVRFSSLDRVKRHILRGAFNNRPPPLPKREQRIDYAASIRTF